MRVGPNGLDQLQVSQPKDSLIMLDRKPASLGNLKKSVC